MAPRRRQGKRSVHIWLKISKSVGGMMVAEGRLFYKKIVERRVIEIVRLQIKPVFLKVNKHIESFEEIIANHAIYILFALHSGCESGKGTGNLRHYIRTDNHFIKKYVFHLSDASV